MEMIVDESNFGIWTSIRMIFGRQWGIVMGELKLKESDEQNQFE
jgi:hypothetical protein